MNIMSGMSTGAKAFARDGSVARSISGGLHRSASRLDGGHGPYMGGMAGLTTGGMRSRGAAALTTMAKYPRGTAAAGAVGAYGMNKRRGSQNYPMY